MKKIVTIPLLGLMLLATVACEKTTKKEDSVERAEEANKAKEGDRAMNTIKEDESAFMVHAASGGMMEVELGRLAETQASHPEVKAFGKTMVTDHTKANEELKKLAADRNITLPATVGNDEQKHIDKLRKLSGHDFDKEYMRMMVDDHEKDVNHFRKAAKDEEFDPAIKAFASATLPVLEKHLEKARQVNDMVENKKPQANRK